MLQLVPSISWWKSGDCFGRGLLTELEFKKVLAPLWEFEYVKTRIRKVANKRGDYHNRIESSLVDSLSVGKEANGGDIIAERIAEITETLISSFEAIAHESAKEARCRPRARSFDSKEGRCRVEECRGD